MLVLLVMIVLILQESLFVQNLFAQESDLSWSSEDIVQTVEEQLRTSREQVPYFIRHELATPANENGQGTICHVFRSDADNYFHGVSTDVAQSWIWFRSDTMLWKYQSESGSFLVQASAASISDPDEYLSEREMHVSTLKAIDNRLLELVKGMDGVREAETGRYEGRYEGQPAELFLEEHRLGFRLNGKEVATYSWTHDEPEWKRPVDQSFSKIMENPKAIERLSETFLGTDLYRRLNDSFQEVVEIPLEDLTEVASTHGYLIPKSDSPVTVVRANYSGHGTWLNIMFEVGLKSFECFEIRLPEGGPSRPDFSDIFPSQIIAASDSVADGRLLLLGNQPGQKDYTYFVVSNRQALGIVGDRFLDDDFRTLAKSLYIP